MRMTSVDTAIFDPALQDRINRLTQEKLNAVAVEDFDMAKHYKQIVDKLKVLGNQMVQLANEKDMAIENEDYDMAKTIKGQIEQIRHVAYQVGDMV